MCHEEQNTHLYLTDQAGSHSPGRHCPSSDSSQLPYGRLRRYRDCVNNFRHASMNEIPVRCLCITRIQWI
jgi:hypothetical protein